MKKCNYSTTLFIFFLLFSISHREGRYRGKGININIVVHMLINLKFILSLDKFRKKSTKKEKLCIVRILHLIKTFVGSSLYQ